MKKRFSKLLLAIVMMLQLVPSSMGTIVANDNVDLGHEAKIGRISDEAIFYLMTRGISEEEARAMLVRGFVEPISKELPLEYAVEMNNLINLELEGSIG